MGERDKALAQLESLRAHLLQREAGHTEDAVRRDNQISYLQQQLREARGERDSIGSSLQSQLSTTMATIDTLRGDITRLTAERNLARADAAAKLAECSRQGQVLANLESVLAAFEVERDSAVAGVREEMEAMQAEHLKAMDDMKKELEETRAQLTRQAQDLKESAYLRSELNLARGLQAAAAAQAQGLQAQLGDAHARLHAALRSADENLIDRRLVGNTLVSYFSAPSHRRDDVLRLLASMLALGEAEQVKVR